MIDKNPLISVYITNYNYGDFIRIAIESVLNQSFQDFELFIIDDGSTDRSKEIIESYSNHEKIKIIFQQNKGLNVTNNIALRVAMGRYIIRLDSDDYLHPDALKEMAEVLELDYDLGLVFPDYFLIDINGKIIRREQRHSFDDDVTLLDQPAHGACTMIRRKFLLNLGGYDEQFRCQDGYDLWIRFTARYKVTNINKPLFYYRQHGKNLTSDERKILDTRAAIKNKFVESENLHNIRTTAIIPVRSSKYISHNLPLLEIHGKTLLERKVEEALNASRINQIVISSPDESILAFCKEKYVSEKSIIYHKRREEHARYNVGLSQTILSILNEVQLGGKPDIMAVLPVEAVFFKAVSIDEAINTLLIFNTDSLISVREVSGTLYSHDGGGMKLKYNTNDKTKYERDALYINTGGIIVFKTDLCVNTNQIIGGTVGHIVVDQKTAMSLKTKLDIKIAELLF